MMMRDKSYTTVAVDEAPGSNPTFLFVVYLITLLCFFMGGTDTNAQDDSVCHPFRLVISAKSFSDVNKADLRAAMKVWMMAISKEFDVPVDPQVYIYHTTEALAEFGRTHRMDGFALTVPELTDLCEEFTFDRFAVALVDGHIGDEYLLLVHRDSGIERLNQLKGLDINVLDHPRMSLAQIWLDTILLEADLTTTTHFFCNVYRNTGTSKVVLPVFFKTCTACLVTRSGFQVMAELNPQLKQQLHIVAVSPTLISGGFAFQVNTANPCEQRLMNAIGQLYEIQAGRQMLTLNQSDAIEVHPMSILDDTLALIAKHRLLCGMETVSCLKPQTQPPKPILQVRK